MEHLIEPAVIAVDVLIEFVEREGHVAHERREPAGLDIGNRLVIGLPPDRLPFDDVARLEQAHEVAEIAYLLIWIVDRHGRDAEHLIAAGPPHRIDAAEAAAMADGE